MDIYFKHDATPDSIKGTVMYLAQNYMLNAISTMLNERFSELAQSANPPFNMAFCSPDGDFFLSGTKKAFNVTAYTKDDGLSNGLKVLLQEVERVRRHGFTESEYARARANILQQLESAYNEREKTNNMAYVNECLQHFLHAEPIPGIEYEYTTLNQLAPNIPVQAINEVAKQLITDNNQAVFIAAPEKEGVVIPTKEEVIADLKAMPTLQVEAYVDKVSNEPLIKEAPQGGKIVSQKENALFGATELTLSNGIMVYVKKTDFKADEIRMHGFSQGGTSLFDAADKLNYSLMNGAVDAGGAGNFSNVELTKVLAGKKVSVSATVGSHARERQWQLLAQGLRDNDAVDVPLPHPAPQGRRSLRLLQEPHESAVGKRGSQPHVRLERHAGLRDVRPERTLLQHEGRHDRPSDYDRILGLYKQAFADCGDFTFILVGNAELDSIKPYIEQYLGALPGTSAKQNYNKANLLIPRQGHEGKHLRQGTTDTDGYCSHDSERQPRVQPAQLRPDERPQPSP